MVALPKPLPQLTNRSPNARPAHMHSLCVAQQILACATGDYRPAVTGLVCGTAIDSQPYIKEIADDAAACGEADISTWLHKLMEDSAEVVSVMRKIAARGHANSKGIQQETFARILSRLTGVQSEEDRRWTAQYWPFAMAALDGRADVMQWLLKKYKFVRVCCLFLEGGCWREGWSREICACKHDAVRTLLRNELNRDNTPYYAQTARKFLSTFPPASPPVLVSREAQTEPLSIQVEA